MSSCRFIYMIFLLFKNHDHDLSICQKLYQNIQNWKLKKDFASSLFSIKKRKNEMQDKNDSKSGLTGI